MFVVIEGMDGVGKTTLIEGLKKILPNDVVYIRDPGGTTISEELRTIVKKEEMSDMTSLYLFLAARQDLFDRIVKPALDDGKMVISDRWAWSTFIYQGVLGGLKEHLIKIPNSTIEPDLIIHLDLPTNETMLRLSNRTDVSPDRYDSVAIHLKNLMRKWYLRLAQSSNVVTLDANRPPQLLVRQSNAAIQEVKNKLVELAKQKQLSNESI